MIKQNPDLTDDYESARDKIIEVVGKEVDIIMDFGIYANLKRKVKTEGDDGE